MPQNTDGHTFHQSISPWGCWRAYTWTPDQEVTQAYCGSGQMLGRCQKSSLGMIWIQISNLSLTISYGRIQIKLLATGKTLDWIFDLTMVNQEVNRALGVCWEDTRILQLPKSRLPMKQGHCCLRVTLILWLQTHAFPFSSKYQDNLWKSCF